MKNDIQGIILDVDGVLIGNKKGYNWPDPHPQVISALSTLRKQGVFVSLCTGKGTFAIKDIVEQAHLDNLHIGDGGAVVVDFLNRNVIKKHIIDSQLAGTIIKLFQEANVYLELYTIEGYYIQKNCVNNITTKQHEDILHMAPILVDSLLQASSSLEIVKIMPIATNEEDKKRLIELFTPFQNALTLQWGVHPTALPLQFGLITLPGISKREAAFTISQAIDVPLDHILGVGDGMTDWQFIELCGYKGAMGNSSEELLDLIKRSNNGYIGTTVNNNGLLDIFAHFKLI